jgi:hypothetical protein
MLPQVSLANGLFGGYTELLDGDIEYNIRDCNPSCLFNLHDTSAAWEWVQAGQCWQSVQTGHQCFSGGVLHDFAVSAVESLCPIQANEILEPSSYLGSPSNAKHYDASHAQGDPIFQGWSRDPEEFEVGVTSEKTAGWTNETAWNVADNSGSSGYGIYFKSITQKEAQLAMHCGMQCTI